MDSTHSIAGKASSDMDDILNKIRNIVRLARRAGTDGERVAAEAAAKRLADRHGIALETIEATDSEIRSDVFFDDAETAYHGIELGYITAVLREHFGIILIQNRRPGSRRVSLTWVGTAINVDIAKHVYTVLLRACRRDWGEARTIRNKWRKTHTPMLSTYKERMEIVRLRNLNQRSFYDGWFMMVHRKLTENPIRNDIEQFKAEKADAERKFREYKEQRDVRERKKQHASSKVDLKSVALGMEAGMKVNLNRPCEGRAGAAPLLR